MGSTGICESCGQSVRLSPGQTGRGLRCPGCAGPVTSWVVEDPAPRRRLRRIFWVALAGLALALVVSLGMAWGLRHNRSPAPGSIRMLSRSTMLGRERMLFPGGEPGEPEAPRPPTEKNLLIEQQVDFHLSIPDEGAPAQESPRFAGRVPAALALASDPARGLIFMAGFDGVLRWFHANDFRPAGSRALPGIAYQLLCDSRRRRLYAALCSTQALSLSLLGDRQAASGDLFVFDLDGLVDHPGEEGPAPPVHRHPCAAQIGAMLLSADGNFLYYLAETVQEVQIACADLRSWETPRVVRLPPSGARALVPSADGATLFGLASGRLFAIDTATWRVRWNVLVGGTVQHLAAGPAGHLYLVERRGPLFLLVLDGSSRRVLSRIALGVEGRPSLCSSPDSRRLYLSNSAVTSGRILALDLASADPRRPRLVGWANSERDRLIRGGILLAGDGRFLVTGVGQLYRVGS